MLKNIYFYRENGLNYQNLSVAKPELLQNSNFDPTKKTKLITHGFEDSANTHTVTDIRDGKNKNESAILHFWVN